MQRRRDPDVLRKLGRTRVRGIDGNEANAVKKEKENNSGKMDLKFPARTGRIGRFAKRRKNAWSEQKREKEGRSRRTGG